jgi:tRNA-splicing ligase RtcB
MSRPQDERPAGAPPIRTWLAEPLPSEVARALDRLARARDVAAIAVLPDVHLAEEVCVGVAVATRKRLLPAAIGGDLGCGMEAIRLDGEAERLDDPALRRRILGELRRAVPARIRHGPLASLALPAELEGARLSAPELERQLERDGRREFATLGRGNHFLELERDQEGSLWLAVHSGSRALGPRIGAWHRRRAERDDAGFEGLEADSDAGRAFLTDVDFALRFAAASRAAMVAAAGAVLAEHLGVVPRPETRIACVHNQVRRETVGAESLWVHRKGAIPAAESEAGIVPGSMGAPTFHVEGRGCASSLHSSAHGAGRALSRGEAHRRISPRELLRQMKGIEFDDANAGRLVDEAPSAYKDVRAVMRAQRELTRIVRTLAPVLVHKGT